MRQQISRSDHRRGILEILFSGICFGFLGIFGKLSYSLNLLPGEFLAFRFIIASLSLGLFLFLFQREQMRMGAKTSIAAFLLGVFGYAVFSSCYFFALKGLSVALTVLLLYTYPIWVTLGSRLFFGERLSRPQWLALPLMMAGLLALLWGEFGARDPLSLLLGFLSSVFYSIYILLSRKWLEGAPSLPSAFFVMLGAALVLGALHVRTIPQDPRLWLTLAGTSLISTIAAMSLFLAGLQKLSGAETSMLSLAEPFTAVILGFLVFEESLSAVQWSGALVVLGGLVFLAVFKDR